MIRIIDHTNMHLYAKTMEQHFRLRHDVFVKENGWSQFDSEGIYEKDQFDNEHAIYAISLDASGDAIGCFRIYPTLLPHMLSEVFPGMIEGPVFRRPDIYEITRFHLNQSARQSVQFLELLTAMQELGLELGLSGYIAISRTLRLPIIQSAGISINPLGLPVLMDNVSNVAVMIDINETSLESVRKTSGNTASVLEHNHSAASTRRAM